MITTYESNIGNRELEIATEDITTALTPFFINVDRQIDSEWGEEKK